MVIAIAINIASVWFSKYSLLLKMLISCTEIFNLKSAYYYHIVYCEILTQTVLMYAVCTVPLHSLQLLHIASDSIIILYSKAAASYM